jgi:hypothetical protein
VVRRPRLDQEILKRCADEPQTRADGQITDTAVQPFLQKYFGSLQTQITCLSFAIPAHTEGRFAIVTDVGQGMRWTQVAH